MSTVHTVCIEVQVNDPRALHAQTLRLLTCAPGGMSPEEAAAWLGTADAPNVEACLRSFFDRGVSPAGAEIVDSSCT